MFRAKGRGSMNTETGRIYDRKRMSQREFEEAVRAAESKGQSVVPISEKVARNRRAGGIAMSRAERRTKRRSENNRKKG